MPSIQPVEDWGREQHVSHEMVPCQPSICEENITHQSTLPANGLFGAYTQKTKTVTRKPPGSISSYQYDSLPSQKSRPRFASVRLEKYPDETVVDAPYSREFMNYRSLRLTTRNYVNYSADLIENTNSRYINMPFQVKKIPVSVDLPVLCLRLIDMYDRFRQHADHFSPNGSQSSQTHSFYRYEAYWLPLAAEHKLHAGAPLDVEWFWMAHMLNPLQYRHDCQRIVGKLVEHRLVSRKKSKCLTDRARNLWQARYTGEPFDFDPNRKKGLTRPLDSQATLGSALPSAQREKVSGDLMAIAHCHEHFFYQVSLPHYAQPQFITEAEFRYKQFLHSKWIQYQIAQNHIQNKHAIILRRCNTKPFHEYETPGTETTNSMPQFSYLPFDIELCWRTHLFQPKSYARDTSCLFGKLLPHPCRVYKACLLSYLDDIDPWEMRQESSTVTVIPGITQLWRKVFPEHVLFKSGCLDRGQSTHGRLRCLESVDMYRMATKCTQVSLSRVSSELRPDPGKFSLRIQPRSQLTSEQEQVIAGVRDVCKLNSNSPARVWTASDSTHPMCRFTMISGVQDQLSIELIDKRGWFCPNNLLLGQVNVKLTDMIEHFYGTRPMEVEIIRKFNQEDGELERDDYVENDSLMTGRLTTSKCTTRRNDELQSSVSMLLSITPPMRHAIRLRVELGPALVCQLSKPMLSNGNLWGPIAPTPSWLIHQSDEKSLPRLQSCNGDVPGDQTIPSQDTPGSIDEEPRSLVLIHRVLNHLDEVVFTVRVMHSISRDVCVVQVFSNGKLLCIGHTIGKDQLPELPFQNNRKSMEKREKTHSSFGKRSGISSNLHRAARMFSLPHGNLLTRVMDGSDSTNLDYTTLVYTQEDQNQSNMHQSSSHGAWGFQPGLEERAMMLRDNKGDWCLMMAHWNGFRRFPDPHASMVNKSNTSNGFSSQSAYYSTKGSGGRLALRLRWLQDVRDNVNYLQVPDAMDSCSIVLNDATVNIRTGEINIGKHCDDVAQNVCLAFCFGTLHVLCQPRIITQECKSHTQLNCCSSMANGPSSSSHTDSPLATDNHDIPTDITASTSFDSNIPAPSGHSAISSDPSQRSTSCSASSRCEVSKRLQWIIGPVSSDNKWTAEIAHLVSEGIPADSDGTVEHQSQVKVLGEAHISAVHSISTDNGADHGREQVQASLSIDEFAKRLILAEARKRHRNMFAGDSDTMTGRLKRGVESSFAYTLCKASGFPIDTLIPSVQYNRQLERSRQLNQVLEGRDELKSDQNGEPGSVSSVRSENTTGQYVFQYPNESSQANKFRLRMEKRHEQKSTEILNGSVDSPPSPANGRVPSHTPNSKVPARQPFIGWHLSDFYDYFLLELPDICSGCIPGCLFCNGLAIL